MRETSARWLDPEGARCGRARWEFAAALALALVSVGIAGGLYSDYRGDDTWITCVYVRNLTRGLGFRFNAADPPVYAATSPLWTLLLAGACALTGASCVAVAQALGAMLAALSLLLFWSWCRGLVGAPALALLSLAMMAFDPHLMKLEWLGMETGLALILLVGTLAVETRARTRFGFASAAALAGLLALTRPEAAVLIVLLAAGRFLSPERRLRPKEILLSVSPWAAIVAPWMVYAWLTFGTFVPTTAIAKRGLMDPWEGLWRGIATLASSQGISLCLLAGGLAALLASTAGNHGALLNALRNHGVLVAWPLMLMGAWVFSGVDPVARYQMLIVPLVVAGGAWGLGRCASALGAGSVRRLAVAAAVVVALFAIQGAAVTSLVTLPLAREFSSGFERAYSRIGRWLADNSAPSASVGVADVGIVSYYAERRTVDLFGLVTPEAQRYRGREAEFLARTRPDYYVHRSRLGEDASSRGDFRRLYGAAAVELFEPLLTEKIGRLSAWDREPWQVTLYRMRWERLPEVETGAQPARVGP